jgi:urea transport system ATP-binding protein
MNENPMVPDLALPEHPSEHALSGVASMGHVVVPGEIDVSHGTILYLEDVTVSFDGFRALNALTLSIDAGELRCIIGPNGAGKTTMMDVITGKTSPDSGKVFLGQSIDLTRMNEPSIARAGIGRKFQKPTVFEQHPVWENLELAMKTDKGWLASLRARLDREAQARIEETLVLIGLESEARRLAGELSHGQKQRLEIGMLLMQQPALLLLDEPAAGMTDDETMQLADLRYRQGHGDGRRARARARHARRSETRRDGDRVVSWPLSGQARQRVERTC